MTSEKTTFALLLGNRGMFPGELMAEARQEIPRLLEQWGYDVLLMDESATRFGAVETPAEGRVFAEFLDQNRGKVDGVILTLPNFGDENGAVAALKDAGLPIFIHAWPDDLDKMAPAVRRDAFCGKFSIMDVFWQHGVKFTVDKPHTVGIRDERFKTSVDRFAGVCRVVKGMSNMVLGAVGARTTAFKTVRFDEVALQRHGITVETYDLTEVFARMKDLSAESPEFREKQATLQEYTCWDGVPAEALEKITRLGTVLDIMIAEYGLDAIALRCWVEMQSQLGISPCVLLSEMNERGIAASCEVDVGNAVAMHALKLASGGPAVCLDWNNNYGDEDDKCILFHCGPVASSCMESPGRVEDHAILRNVVGEGKAFGCNVGRILPGAFTYASTLTDSGRIRCYVGEGEFTSDPIPADFFGCAGVARMHNMQDVLQHVGKNGYRHHVSTTHGQVAWVLEEAFTNYLGYDMTAL